mmetsp:Transcript_108055/g.306375  ORF Transcript_108055/g.306375 Transcript_108055/m.306375 type:complete len:141 (+) Transcript_108055:64-486(+)
MALGLVQFPFIQISSTRSGIDDLGGGRRGRRSSHSRIVLHCMISVGFAAAVVCAMSALGLVGSGLDPASGREDPLDTGGYSLRGAWKDLRSIISFVLGAVVTSLVGGDFSAPDPADGDGNEPEDQSAELMEKLIFFSTFM